MRTFKTEIFPTAEQQEYIRKACGVRRWTWNWAVNVYFAEAKNDNFLSAFDLQKLLNNTLVLQPGYEWLSEVSSHARSEALKDFGLAIKAYSKARHSAKRTADKLPVEKYKPSFKKKGKCSESFRLFKKNPTDFKVHSDHDLSVVTVRGKKRMHIRQHESVAFLMSADIKTCTFSMKGGKFFISITYEKTNQRVRKCGTGKVGIDLGIKHPLVAFDGNQVAVHDVPANLRKAEKLTERWNKRLSRTQKGSKRHAKTLQGLQRAYMHEANIKKDWREKLTTALVLSYGQINIDDFGFEGAMNLKHSHRALQRVGVYEFKLRLEEKAAETGCQINFIPRGTPTSMTCHCCGAKKKVQLSDRTYHCSVCGLVYDRDANAAHNVYNYC